MVKLDVSLLRYLTKDDLRVLTSVEMGMKNHELVPHSLVGSISHLRTGGVAKILRQLCQHKLLSYESGKRFDGYRLTYSGYDYLALNVLSNRSVITSVGNQIGVGKESDVYVATDDSGTRYAVKFHRLGRTCFRKVMEKRDYSKSGFKTNWIYLSRLAALREFAFMKLLAETDAIPVPKPVDCNRHCLVMQLIDGTLLNQLSKEDIDHENVVLLYDRLMNLIMLLANDYGLVHGDFNEFNIMITADYKPVLIDFPQMISVSHKSANTYFERDVNCIVIFFVKRFAYESEFIPCFESIDTDDRVESVAKINSIVRDIDGEGDRELIDVFHANLSLQECDENISDEKCIEQNEMTANLDNIKITDSLEVKEDEQVIDSEAIHLNKRTTDSDNVSDDCVERDASSVVSSSFSSIQIKHKLKNERIKRESRVKTKRVIKNIKSDKTSIRRQRDMLNINEDLKAYSYEHSD